MHALPTCGDTLPVLPRMHACLAFGVCVFLSQSQSPRAQLRAGIIQPSSFILHGPTLVATVLRSTALALASPIDSSLVRNDSCPLPPKSQREKKQPPQKKKKRANALAASGSSCVLRKASPGARRRCQGWSHHATLTARQVPGSQVVPIFWFPWQAPTEVLTPPLLINT